MLHIDFRLVGNFCLICLQNFDLLANDLQQLTTELAANVAFAGLDIPKLALASLESGGGRRLPVLAPKRVTNFGQEFARHDAHVTASASFSASVTSAAPMISGRYHRSELPRYLQRRPPCHAEARQ